MWFETLLYVIEDLRIMLIISSLVYQIFMKLTQVIGCYGIKSHGVTSSTHDFPLETLEVLQLTYVMLMMPYGFLFHRMVLGILLALIHKTVLVTFSALADVDVRMMKLLNNTF